MKYQENVFYHYTSPHYTKCANSALLACCYLVKEYLNRLLSRKKHLKKPFGLLNRLNLDLFEMQAMDNVHINAL